MSKRKAITCKVPGCNKPHHAQGYCQNCYDNLRKKKKKAGTAKGVSRTQKQIGELDLSAGKRASAGPARPSDKARAVQATAPSAAQSAAGEEAPKSGRLALLKARHEAIKREIDQIREDLEAEAED
ncbi:MAG: hypothetical protein NTW87_26635 [Planctomycetota bacterium]|nr:hypothetical protein [Planctomycetota bacterium]